MNFALKKGSFSSAVNAETNRGKAAGLYIERKIIKHGKLEDMSEQELEAKMKQILDDYAPILNVTPEACIVGPKTITNQSKEKTNRNLCQKILLPIRHLVKVQDKAISQYHSQ